MTDWCTFLFILRFWPKTNLSGRLIVFVCNPLIPISNADLLLYAIKHFKSREVIWFFLGPIRKALSEKGQKNECYFAPTHWFVR